MDGDGRRPGAATRTSRSSTWASPAASARASATPSSTAAASAGWPEPASGRAPPCRDFFDVRWKRARPESATRGAVGRACRRPLRCTPAARAPAVARTAGGSVGPARRRRRARRWRRLPVLRKHECWNASRPAATSAGRRRRRQGLRRLRGRRHGRGAARVRLARPDLRTRKRPRRDYWRFARALYAAGFRPGQLVLQQLLVSLHAGRLHDGNRARTPWAARCSRAAPARPSSRCAPIADLRARAAIPARPSFLKILLEKADELGMPLPSLKRAGVGRSLSALAARLAGGARHRGPTRPTAAPTWA